MRKIRLLMPVKWTILPS